MEYQWGYIDHRQFSQLLFLNIRKECRAWSYFWLGPCCAISYSVWEDGCVNSQEFRNPDFLHEHSGHVYTTTGISKMNYFLPFKNPVFKMDRNLVIDK